MDNVYLVIREFDYDTTLVEKVFVKKQSAEKYAQKEEEKIDSHYTRMKVLRKRLSWS